MEKETWKNVTRSRVGILKFDRFGETTRERVPGGKVVQVTVDERLLNSDRAASSDLDVFNNGWLVPVRLIDEDEDSVVVKENPNLKSEDDLRELFGLHWKTFEKEIARIDNPVILTRLQELSDEDDNLNMTVKQSKLIEDRLAELTQPEERPDIDDDDDDVLSRIRAVTPS